MTADEAILVMARHVINVLAVDPEWEMWPEVGETDWERIVDRVAELAAPPAGDDFKTAYAVLTERSQSGRPS